MSQEPKTSMKKKSKSKSESPSREKTPTVKKKTSISEGGGNTDEIEPRTSTIQDSGFIDGIEPLPPTPSAPSAAQSTASSTDPVPKTPSSAPPGSRPSNDQIQPTGSSDQPAAKGKKKDKNAPKKGGSGTPRGAHNGSKSHRGEMKFGERPSAIGESEVHEADHPDEGQFDPSKYERMSAMYFHKYNDLSRSARGVGYTPDQAVPRYGPGVTEEAESLYGPCRLLTDFQYSTWTETVVPLRNHNVVQGFNEMILFLIKLAADPDGPVNHEEAFMATSFLANIRNDLGEHPPNVLALLEYIDRKTMDDGTEPADPEIEVVPPCKAAERY